MAEFFIGVPDRLELFGELHIALGFFVIAAALIIYFFRHRLRALPQRKIRIAMAAVLGGNMAVHYISKLLLGVWRFDTDLPLHICFITNFLIIYILLTDNKSNIYRIVYYFTFIGPLPAMIWPDLDYGWQSYTFYQFVISHHIMLLISLYCLFVLDYRVELRSALPAFVGGNTVIFAVAVFNRIFGTNYIMMNELPEQLYEVYPFIDAFPPIVWLELVGVLAMLGAYIPAMLRGRTVSIEEEEQLAAEY